MSDGFAFSLQAKVERLERTNAELLAALEELLAAVGVADAAIAPVYLDAARGAIAKARGAA